MHYKKAMKIVAAALVALMAVAMFTDCGKETSSIGKIKSAFEKEGYTINAEVQAQYDQMVAAIKNQVTSMQCYTKETGAAMKIAVIMEFKSTKELDKNKDQPAGLYTGVTMSDYINGNCMLLNIPMVSDASVVGIFKAA